MNHPYDNYIASLRWQHQPEEHHIVSASLRAIDNVCVGIASPELPAWESLDTLRAWFRRTFPYGSAHAVIVDPVINGWGLDVQVGPGLARARIFLTAAPAFWVLEFDEPMHQAAGMALQALADVRCLTILTGLHTPGAKVSTP